MVRKERRELKSPGRDLDNREICDYFRGDITKNHKRNNVIVHRCLSVDFINKVDCSEEEFHRANLLYFKVKLMNS